MFLKEALFYGKKVLIKSASGFLDTILLLKKITGLEKEKILLDDNQFALDDNMMKKFFYMLDKRLKNMPMQYILNEAEFMGLKFYVDQNVLIPRSATEILVECVVSFLNANNGLYKILELCTGSGCISIALKKFKKQILLEAIDIDSNAINVAKKNARLNHVEVNFICADIFKIFCSEFAKRFDIIIFNPPYIKSGEIKNLEVNVKNYEPKLALDGGPDGLKFYKFILSNIKHECNIFFEMGFDQKDDIKKILSDNDFYNIRVIKDLEGFNRVISAKRYVDV